jgi:tRNA(Arg) A34 adenosine deaminase TadA
MEPMQNSWMRRAIELAVENVRAAKGGPFGAVIVKDGRIIAEGTNLVTSTNDPTAHAEIVAIREACRALGRFHLTGCEIYTSCEPCPMCLAAIYWARLEKVFFGGTRADAVASGFDDESIYHEIETPLSDRRLPMVQLMRDDALRAFEAWTQAEGRIDY